MSLIYTCDQNQKDGPNNGQSTYQKPNSVYIGGKSEAKDKSKLLKWGITHILNVTPSKEVAIASGVANFFESSSSFKYLRVAVYDSPTSASDLFINADSIVTFIHNALYHGSVFVHCQKGRSRSATSVAFYLMRKRSMSLANALRLMKKRRPVIDPIPAFLVQLEKYELKCKDLGLVLIDDHDHDDANQDKSSNLSCFKKRTIVGPSLPSNIATKRSKLSELVGSTTIGPCLPPSVTKRSKLSELIGPTVIGPSLPPNMPPKTEVRPIIGPSLPPKTSQNENANTSTKE